MDLIKELEDLAGNNKILLAFISVLILLAKLFGWNDDKVKARFLNKKAGLK
jgi:hypothetical protein